MSSIRRIEASRANGALSHGPVTPEGKARSAANATTHGLLARTAVLDTESKEAFQALLDEFVLYFRPKGAAEYALVEELVVATWRTRRCWGIETRMVSDAAENCAVPGGVAALVAAYSELAGRPGLPLLNRYESRANHIYQRALKNFFLLRQNQQLPNEPNPVSEHSAAPATGPDPDTNPPIPAALPEPNTQLPNERQ
jgi:hypothetical protein